MASKEFVIKDMSKALLSQLGPVTQAYLTPFAKAVVEGWQAYAPVGNWKNYPRRTWHLKMDGIGYVVGKSDLLLGTAGKFTGSVHTGYVPGAGNVSAVTFVPGHPHTGGDRYALKIDQGTGKYPKGHVKEGQPRESRPYLLKPVKNVEANPGIRTVAGAAMITAYRMLVGKRTGR